MDNLPLSHLPPGPYAPPPASVLSEDAIKRIFLPFLKQFYKFRYEYRPETITTELDNVSAEGWVADGMVQFRKEDGSLFTCTYEATSLDKAGEVKYAQNVPYFLWDCAAFGVFAAAVVYVISYVVRFRWLVNLQWNGNAGLVIGIAMMGFLGWFFLMRKWKKYRYIYAIEQFKRYFAEEQWVALGDDVFPSPIDPYLVELKDQCVYNGFGLALVSIDGQVRPLATPSRIGIYGRDRKMTQWVTRTDFYQALSKNINTLAANRPKAPDALHIFWNQLWRPVQRFVIQPFRKATGNAGETPSIVFDRFMSANSVQKWMLSFSLAVIALLGYRVLTFTEDSRYGDISDYRSDELTGNPEDQNYSLDPRDEPVPYVSVDRSGIPKQYPEPPFGTPARMTERERKASAAAAKKNEEEVQTITISSGEDDDTPTLNISGDEEPAAQATPPSKAPKLPAPKPVADPCARLYGGWFVQDNAFSSQGFADERMAALRKAGVTCASAPRSCVEKGKSGFIVWLGTTQKTEAAAQQKAADYEKTLKKSDLLRGPLLVRKIGQ